MRKKVGSLEEFLMDFQMKGPKISISSNIHLSPVARRFPKTPSPVANFEKSGPNPKIIFHRVKKEINKKSKKGLIFETQHFSPLGVYEKVHEELL